MVSVQGGTGWNEKKKKVYYVFMNINTPLS